jgi:hypothetical protein
MKNAFETSGTSPSETEADFSFQDESSICLLIPHNELARSWIDENIGPDNGFQPYYPTIVIEPRFVRPIIEGIQNDGMEVQ